MVFGKSYWNGVIGMGDNSAGNENTVVCIRRLVCRQKLLKIKNIMMEVVEGDCRGFRW